MQIYKISLILINKICRLKIYLKILIYKVRKINLLKGFSMGDIKMTSEEMKLVKFETIITDLWKNFNGFKWEKTSNKSPLKYLLGEKVVKRRERYETGIYIKNIKNIVDYDTESYDSEQNIKYVATKDEKVINQIIMPGNQANAEKNSLIKNI